MKLRKLRSGMKIQASRLSEQGFRQIFDRINQLSIKNGVDKQGLDKFIDQCAYLAAGSGVISGTGGFVTMVVGVPLDFVNLITQQFRVTMAIMYAARGHYHVNFEEFMQFIATSLKVEAGVTLTKTMLERVAEKLLMILGTRTAERLIPVVGAAIGGAANFMFIKRMAQSVKEMEHFVEPVVVEIL